MLALVGQTSPNSLRVQRQSLYQLIRRRRALPVLRSRAFPPDGDLSRR
jgi:hypothetical protein